MPQAIPKMAHAPLSTDGPQTAQCAPPYLIKKTKTMRTAASLGEARCTAGSQHAWRSNLHAWMREIWMAMKCFPNACWLRKARLYIWAIQEMKTAWKAVQPRHPMTPTGTVHNRTRPQAGLRTPTVKCSCHQVRGCSILRPYWSKIYSITKINACRFWCRSGSPRSNWHRPVSTCSRTPSRCCCRART